MAAGQGPRARRVRQHQPTNGRFFGKAYHYRQDEEWQDILATREKAPQGEVGIGIE